MKILNLINQFLKKFKKPKYKINRLIKNKKFKSNKIYNIPKIKNYFCEKEKESHFLVIYQLINKINHHGYVGRTFRKGEVRFKEHLTDIKNSRMKNKKINEDHQKFGNDETIWDFKVIQVVKFYGKKDFKLANEIENIFINKIKPLYNINTPFEYKNFFEQEFFLEENFATMKSRAILSLKNNKFYQGINVLKGSHNTHLFFESLNFLNDDCRLAFMNNKNLIYVNEEYKPTLAFYLFIKIIEAYPIYFKKYPGAHKNYLSNLIKFKADKWILGLDEYELKKYGQCGIKETLKKMAECNLLHHNAQKQLDK